MPEDRENGVPTMSDKAADFKRLAVKRTNRALNSIRLIGNLSSANYEKTPEQVELILSALRASVAEVEGKFAGSSDRPEFSL